MSRNSNRRSPTNHNQKPGDKPSEGRGQPGIFEKGLSQHQLPLSKDLNIGPIFTGLSQTSGFLVSPDGLEATCLLFLEKQPQWPSPLGHSVATVNKLQKQLFRFKSTQQIAGLSMPIARPLSQAMRCPYIRQTSTTLMRCSASITLLEQLGIRRSADQ